MSSDAQSLYPVAPAWEVPMPPTDLIFDDGVPLESKRHRTAMNTLIRSLDHAWLERDDYFAGGNMFIYYSSEQALNRDFRGPDFFAVLDIDGTYTRRGWVAWLEGGRYPDVIVELLSPSTAEIDKGVKKDLYEQVFKTRDYFVFDPYDSGSLQGWTLDLNLRYQPLEANARGWLWSRALGLWLGTWEGTTEREGAEWLRFYDEDGNLVPLPEESAWSDLEQAEQERDQAREQLEQARTQAEQQSLLVERLAERLRELGESDTL
ncbi:MAG: Uma2 family endonuclease [Gemmatimonadaceae bacterium]|nr:Uma2 family endonuclease [Gloeobacterales cyanobacterium ES-bin-141]